MTKQFLPDIFGRSGSVDVFSSLQREIDRVFNDFSRGLPAFGDMRKAVAAPKVNFAETEKHYEVSAEIPGVNAEDVDVQLRDGVLTIRGEKKEEKQDKNKDYHIVERSYGMFERSFSLPSEVDGDGVKASFDKGVLHVVLPKLPEAQSKAKKITVTAKS